MKIKIFTILALLIAVSSTFAQANLNDYKYVIVPTKYDFLKESNQYQLNALSQFLFNKYGFETLMEGDEYPEDLVRNRCLGLRSNVTKDNGLFKTKLIITLRGCNDQVIYTSKMGESREKEYKKAYVEAIRNAFKSFETINYNYQPTKEGIVVSTKEEVKTEVNEEIEKLKEEIKALKQEKKAEVAEEMPEVEEIETTVVVPAAIEEAVKKRSSKVLYAQEIENGFQLVDSSPKVVYKIKKTSMKDVFLVVNKNGTLSKKGADWVLEYYENDVLKQKVLNIKF